MWFHRRPLQAGDIHIGEQSKSMYRPPSVTAISWYLIIGGALSLFSPVAQLTSPDGVAVMQALELSPWFIIVSGLVRGVVCITCGAALLNQQKRGRTLYLAYMAVSIPAYLLATDGFDIAILLFQVPVVALVLFFLFRPQVNRYFAGELHQKPKRLRLLSKYRRGEQSESDLRRVFGVIIMAGGGFLTSICILVLASAVGAGAVTVLMLLLLPTFAGLFLGAYLWGIDRIRASIGWTLVGAGGVTGTTGLYFWLFVPTLHDILAIPPRQLEIMSQGALKLGVFGLITAIIGAISVWSIWNEDIEEVTDELSSTTKIGVGKPMATSQGSASVRTDTSDNPPAVR